MTGIPASGPMLPSPSTAVPSLTTATELPRPVYSQTASGLLWISMQGTATPGVYARERSSCVLQGFVGTEDSLPFGALP